MATISLQDWAHVYGAPLLSARLRSIPEDFQVTEQLGWECSGDGEHDYLFVEKTGANTEWVARQLAHHADVPVRDVGYAGLKDRHAITRQWFSVPRWNAPNWSTLDVLGVTVVETQRHLRKLRRGAHKGNDFQIVLRCDSLPDADAWAGRIARIGEQGVPNYFGEQRFGRSGRNLQLADDWAAGKRLPREQRSMAISTIRSYVFNETLCHRVQASTWNQLVADDMANLDGSGSVFEVADIGDDLRQRCSEMDIHPAGILVGDGSTLGPAHWQKALSKARVEPSTRSLRLPVRNLRSEFGLSSVVLRFSLGRGAYATAVLRELCEWE